MHYRTPRISFLETEEEFLNVMAQVQRLDSPEFETGDLEKGDTPLVIVPSAP